MAVDFSTTSHAVFDDASAVLGESAFLKIDGKSAWRDHRLIVFATDGHRHAGVKQDINEGLGRGSLNRVHSPSGVSIILKSPVKIDNGGGNYFLLGF